MVPGVVPKPHILDRRSEFPAYRNSLFARVGCFALRWPVHTSRGALEEHAVVQLNDVLFALEKYPVLFYPLFQVSYNATLQSAPLLPHSSLQDQFEPLQTLTLERALSVVSHIPPICGRQANYRITFHVVAPPLTVLASELLRALLDP